MEGTDPAGHKTLQEHFSTVCDSALDPSVLARHLFTKGIINNTARKAAKQQLTPKDHRLDDLLGQVMANGTPGAFQTFVEAVEKLGAVDWLVEKLKGVFVIIKPRCTIAARAYGSHFVCACLSVSVCLLLEYLLYRCVLAESKCLFGNNIVFSWILIRGFR